MIHHQDIKLKNYNFLITGGAGFIGSHIVEYLLLNNAGNVRVLDNFSTGSKNNLKHLKVYPNLEILEGDIRDLKTCRSAVQDIDFVSHQAALGSVPRSIKDPITTNAVNINGFLNMLVAISTQKRIKRFVYAASSSTYGDSKALPKQEDIIGKPLSPYAVTKLVNELYADVFSKINGFTSVGLRYFNVFGPRQSPKGAYAAVIPLFLNAIKKKESPIIHGDGMQTRDFTYIGNVVQANIKSFFNSKEEGHQVYNIACGSRISINELWGILKTAGNSNLEPVHTEPRQGDVRDSLADILKAKKHLGYIPEFNVKTGLKLTWDWFKDLEKTNANSNE